MLKKIKSVFEYPNTVRHKQTIALSEFYKISKKQSETKHKTKNKHYYIYLSSSKGEVLCADLQQYFETIGLSEYENLQEKKLA